jgi:hypothetical protein
VNRFVIFFVVLATSVLSGCANEPPVPNYMFSLGAGTVDFTVGLTRTDPVFVSWLASGLQPGTAAEADAYFTEHLRVYSIDSGQRLAGEVRVGFWAMDGTELSEPIRVPNEQEGYSFIPDVPLTDGWYIAALDLGGWRASHLVNNFGGGETVHAEGDVLYSRFHMGPAPVWFATDFYPVEPGDRSTIGPRIGVPVLELLDNPFSLRMDGVVDSRCTEHRDPDYGWWYWECPALSPTTEITVRLEDDSVVEALGGVRVQTLVAADSPEIHRRIDQRFGIDIARGAP